MGKVIAQDSEIPGGKAIFKETRVPVKGLFGHLEAGDSIEDFLDGFPRVKREQVIILWDESKARALALA